MNSNYFRSIFFIFLLLLSFFSVTSYADDGFEDIDTSSAFTEKKPNGKIKNAEDASEYLKTQKIYNSEFRKFSEEQMKIREEYQEKHKNDPDTKEARAAQQKFYDEWDEKFQEYEKKHALPKLTDQEIEAVEKQKMIETYGSADPVEVTDKYLSQTDILLQANDILQGKYVIPESGKDEGFEFKELVDGYRNEIDKLYKEKKPQEAKAMEDKMYEATNDWLETHPSARPTIEDVYEHESDWTKSQRSTEEEADAPTEIADIDRAPEVTIDAGEVVGEDVMDESLLADIDTKSPTVEESNVNPPSAIPLIEKHEWQPMPAPKKHYKKKYPSMKHIQPIQYRAPASIDCS